MNNVNQVFNLISRLTETEKKQAGAIAEGNFEKILAEYEIIQPNFFGKNNWIRNSRNQFENSRAYDIRDIFFLQQKERKKTELPIFDKDAPFDLKKLRRDPTTPFETPAFLEKRFELFGPTVISRFV